MCSRMKHARRSFLGDFLRQERPEVLRRVRLDGRRVRHKRNGGARLRVVNGLMAKCEHGFEETLFVATLNETQQDVLRGNHCLHAELGENLGGLSAEIDSIVRLDDSDTAQPLQIVAAAQNAHVGEHVMRPAAKVQRFALAETPHVDLLADTPIQLEEHAATAEHQNIAVLGNHEIHVVVAVQKPKLCVGLIWRDDVVDLVGPELLDERNVQLRSDVDRFVVVLARLGDVALTLQLIRHLEVVVARPRNDHDDSSPLFPLRIRFLFVWQIRSVENDIGNDSVLDEFFQSGHAVVRQSTVNSFRGEHTECSR